MGVLWAVAFWSIVTQEFSAQLLSTLMRGVQITVFVTITAFSGACTLGLLLALGLLARHPVPRTLARVYVELMRGLPILVLLLYVAFVVAPALVIAWNWVATGLGFDPIRNRDFPLLWRAILALTLGYAAFIAEVFRAGLQSVDPGQIEAAKALGLRHWHRFRLIVLPQAIRTILPPLGNDFVAMVKDSSLVSVLGVLDITQLGKVTAAANFRYFETYNIVAFLYLTLTISLSLILQRIEMRLRKMPG
ncbi:MAG: amino acid ABC transporter permease [Pseudomonadota bacterium]